MKNSILIIFIALMSLNLSCAQQTENEVNNLDNPPFTAELIIDELQIPWGFTFLPDGSMLITEKAGQLIHFKDGKKNIVDNVPAVDDKGGNTSIIRAKLNNNSLTDIQLLYKATPNTTKGQHFGSRIVFDDKGYLFFSIGERGDRDVNPQDITRDGGKIYRLNADGSIPSDNPFVNTAGAKTAIYSYGHRNPQGLAKNPMTGEIWDNEHGPQGGDEINVIEKGKNYGWPVITYGINYSGTPITDKTEMEGMEQPIHYWVPSIAPSGMAFVTSDKYPDWKGNSLIFPYKQPCCLLLIGSLKFQYLERLELKGNKVVYREKLMPDLGRVRDVRQAPDGFIYVAVEGKGIYKLVPKK